MFKRLNPALRQQLLQFVLSNVELNDKFLSYTINDPFREVVELNKLAAKQLTLAKWQGCQFWNGTFDDEMECDIEEIRHLFDDIENEELKSC